MRREFYKEKQPHCHVSRRARSLLFYSLLFSAALTSLYSHHSLFLISPPLLFLNPHFLIHLQHAQGFSSLIMPQNSTTTATGTRIRTTSLFPPHKVISSQTLHSFLLPQAPFPASLPSFPSNLVQKRKLKATTSPFKFSNHHSLSPSFPLLFPLTFIFLMDSTEL